MKNIRKNCTSNNVLLRQTLSVKDDFLPLHWWSLLMPIFVLRTLQGSESSCQGNRVCGLLLLLQQTSVCTQQIDSGSYPKFSFSPSSSHRTMVFMSQSGCCISLKDFWAYSCISSSHHLVISSINRIEGLFWELMSRWSMAWPAQWGQLNRTMASVLVTLTWERKATLVCVYFQRSWRILQSISVISPCLEVHHEYSAEFEVLNLTFSFLQLTKNTEGCDEFHHQHLASSRWLLRNEKSSIFSRASS